MPNEAGRRPGFEFAKKLTYKATWLKGTKPSLCRKARRIIQL